MRLPLTGEKSLAQKKQQQKKVNKAAKKSQSRTKKAF